MTTPLAWTPALLPADAPAAARPRMGAASAALPTAWGDALVLHGGLGADRYALDDVAVLLDERWHAPAVRGPRPAPRAFHAAAPLGRRVAVFGGHVFSTGAKRVVKHDTLFLLDTDTWTWRPAGGGGGRGVPTPPARDFAALAPLPCGARLLLTGGLDARDRRLDDAWVYDAGADAWAEVRAAGPRPAPRHGHTLTLAANRTFLFGGETAAGPSAELWVFKPGDAASEVDPAWVRLDLPGPAPAPRKGHAAAALGAWLVIVGGRTADAATWFSGRAQTLTNDVAVMAADAGGVRWLPAAAAAAPAPREFAVLAPLAGARLLLCGGGDGASVLTDAAVLDTRLAPFAGAAAAGAAAAGLARAASARPPPPRLRVGRADDDASPPPSPLSSLAGTPTGDRAASPAPTPAPREWWAGCAPVAALRARVGLPSPSPSLPRPSRLSSTGTASRTPHQIVNTPIADLTLGDVDAALAYLAAAFRGGLSPAAPLDAASMSGRGRYLHASRPPHAAWLRVGDVAGVVEEVGAVVAGQQADR